MAPLYSVYSEQPVTVAQLLGEEEDTAAAEAEGATAAAARLELILTKRKERAVCLPDPT